MKLESFKAKKVTKRKMIIISLGVITIVGVSLLLYKTYIQFRGEVDLDNNNVLFGFYNGNTRLDEMPQKVNSDNLVFEKAECDNGATVEWDNEKWAPLVKGLNKKKTKCTLYFGEKKLTGVELLEKKAEEEQTKPEPELMYDDTEDRNLRYVGANPNNYIKIANNKYDHDIYVFRSGYVLGKLRYNSMDECENDNQEYIQQGNGSCELLHKQGEPILWRIIGVMKNVTNVETGKEEDLIKIIRADSISYYPWDVSASEVNNGRGVNEWSQADLMKLLNPGYSDNRDSICVETEYGDCISYSENQLINNSLYWNNESGQCYAGKTTTETCDFTNSGISEEAKNKIAKVRWNTGTFATDDSSEWTASATYKAERSENNGKQLCESNGGGSDCNDEVPRTTTWDGYIGLVNPSDFGYAVGKSVRNACLLKSMYDYGGDGCDDADWLTIGNYDGGEWTINSAPSSSSAKSVFKIDGTGYMDTSLGTASNTGAIRPVVFLKSNVTFSNASGTPEDPFVAS